MTGHPADTDLRVTFREAVSSTWVICATDGTRPVGFTAISVVSVSVSPPLVSFNLSKTSSSRSTVEASGRVSLHLLASHQSHIARRFAGDRGSRFVGDWHWHDDGLPALTEFCARLSANITATVDAGDSLVVTARVMDQEQGHGDPLVHHQGAYRSLDRTPSLILQEESA